jgi:hypothetical protein
MPKSLWGSMLFGENLKLVHRFGFYCIFIYKFFWQSGEEGGGPMSSPTPSTPMGSTTFVPLCESITPPCPKDSPPNLASADWSSPDFGLGPRISEDGEWRFLLRIPIRFRHWRSGVAPILRRLNFGQTFRRQEFLLIIKKIVLFNLNFFYH